MKTRIRRTLRTISYNLKSPFLDIGKPDDAIIVAGMGRSGTTWAADIINYDDSYRILFEPFLPNMVKEAEGFGYKQYLAPGSDNPVLATKAKKILAGKPRNRWVDRGNNRLFYRRRIIKDIRINLMLAWLKKTTPATPVVLTIRHPLQVLSSWAKLGWRKEAFGERSNLEILASQKNLLDDFPIIHDVLKCIDPQDFVETVVFEWCVLHFIPSRHLDSRQAYALFYEYLLADPENEVERLFHYLGKSFDLDRIRKAMKKSSSTNFLDRDYRKDRQNLLSGWKEEFSSEQVERANEMLSIFGLDYLYDESGNPTGAPLFCN